ncbi:hypothetical protein CEXT_740911 [Caerostris extrusa]|uniref:Uncharacterized protein n=1 Tax=Caerostris extrusa TaxID=172846 RepID=A0AAV4VRM1_CAEEX|nr:hypothetical protein CEXT_740911 [Caerostris extrusa]
MWNCIAPAAHFRHSSLWGNIWEISETSPKVLSSSRGPVKRKEATARFIRETVLHACLFMKRLTHRDSVTKRVFQVTKNFTFGAGATIFQLNQRPLFKISVVCFVCKHV